MLFRYSLKFVEVEFKARDYIERVIVIVINEILSLLCNIYDYWHCFSLLFETLRFF